MTKFKFLFIFAILSGVSYLHAEAKQSLNGRFMPDPQGYSSGAVYITSNTCAEQTGSTIAARPALLYAVNVTTPGGPGSIMQLFDAQVSGQRSLTNKIITTSATSWFYEVGASSGLFLTNTGGACLSIVYLER